MSTKRYMYFFQQSINFIIKRLKKIKMSYLLLGYVISGFHQKNALVYNQ